MNTMQNIKLTTLYNTVDSNSCQNGLSGSKVLYNLKSSVKKLDTSFYSLDAFVNCELTHT